MDEGRRESEGKEERREEGLWRRRRRVDGEEGEEGEGV